MISCPAAKGIICSICRPSATDEPSGTNSEMASCMERSFVVILLDLRRRLRSTRECRQARNRSQYPQPHCSFSCVANSACRCRCPRCKDQAESKIEQHQAEKHSLAPALGFSEKSGTQHQPDCPGQDRPPLVLPVEVAFAHLRIRQVRKIYRDSCGGDSPGASAAHQVRRFLSQSLLGRVSLIGA